MSARRTSLVMLPLEDRSVPAAYQLQTSFAAGEDTLAKADRINYDPDYIRKRTGDPTLASPYAYALAADGTTEFSVGMGFYFTGGARVTRADVTGDGIEDLVVASGPGTVSSIKIYTPGNYTPLFTYAPFESTFLGGVHLSAGDLTGDGIADVIVSPDMGGGPRAIILRGGDFQPIASFLAIDDPAFRGGILTAVADFDGDGTGDLVAAAGFGGGPRVAVFDGTTVATTPTRLYSDLLVFENQIRNGCFVGAGDLDGDGVADLFTAAGAGGAPRLQVLSGSALMSGGTTVLANFFVGGADARSGLRITVKDLDGDAYADLVTGSGPGTGNVIRIFKGTEVLSTAGIGQSVNPFFSFGFSDGVWVG